MNLQRMRFAWVRGARFQHQHATTLKWVDLPRSCSPVYVDSDRIHPEDAHLEYGPISSELRRKALEDERIGGWHIDQHGSQYRTCVYLGLHAYFEIGFPATDAEIRMMYLFVAELLADEGL